MLWNALLIVPKRFRKGLLLHIIQVRERGPNFGGMQYRSILKSASELRAAIEATPGLSPERDGPCGEVVWKPRPGGTDK